MDDRGFRELYAYRVVAGDLTNNEIRDLSHLLHADVNFGPCECEDPNDIPLLKEPVEFWLKHSNVLLPTAGAVGKAGLDVLVDILKKWLEARPEVEDRKVDIYGPDYEVVRIVKTGKEIRASSGKIWIRRSGK